MIRLFFLIIFINAIVFTQSSVDNKNEYYVGYSNQQVNDAQRETFNGFEVSYTRNFSRYVGAKADFSAAFFKRTTVSGNINIEDKRSVYNILGGIQIRDNTSQSRIQPFAHFLAGVAHTRNKFICPPCLNPLSVRNETGLAGAFGGGLDIKLNDKIRFRAIQADYNPIKADGRVINNIRLGVGISFK